MVGSANTHIGFFANSGSTHWLGWVWGASYIPAGMGTPTNGGVPDLRLPPPRVVRVTLTTLTI